MSLAAIGRPAAPLSVTAARMARGSACGDRRRLAACMPAVASPARTRRMDAILIIGGPCRMSHAEHGGGPATALFPPEQTGLRISLFI